MLLQTCYWPKYIFFIISQQFIDGDVAGEMLSTVKRTWILPFKKGSLSKISKYTDGNSRALC